MILNRSGGANTLALLLVWQENCSAFIMMNHVKCRGFIEAFEQIQGRSHLFLVHCEVAVAIVFNHTRVSIFFSIFTASDKRTTLFFYLFFSQNVDLC